jgi:hypothetical protein
MTRALEARVAKLEQAIGARDQLVVVVHTYAGGDLLGYTCNLHGHEPLEITRQPGESDRHLLGRAEKEAELSGLAVNGCLALRELRR